MDTNAIIIMELYYNMGKILTEDECMNLGLEVLENKQKGSVALESDTRYYRNSYGGTTPGSWEMLERFTPIVNELTGLSLKPANPYCRIYNNTSTLNPHIDREGLDWTLSICLFTNIDHDWPLFAKIGEEILGFPTRIGEGALMAGRQLEHWREPLVCSDDQYVVQMFLHWSQE